MAKIKVEVEVPDGNDCANKYESCSYISSEWDGWFCNIFEEYIRKIEKCQRCIAATVEEGE